MSFVTFLKVNACKLNNYFKQISFFVFVFCINPRPAGVWIVTRPAGGGGGGKDPP